MIRRACQFGAVVVVAIGCAGARAGVVTVGAAADNTLYEDSAGSLSNGAGQYIFAGRTSLNAVRRAVIRFDVAAAIPPGSVVQGVTLRLNMSRGISSLSAVSLHRALRAWGEGTSDALDEEGIGIGATPGDATWLHTFFPDQFWTIAGGDFAAASSAATPVSVTGVYTWSSAAMVADVQAWLDDPGANFGWFILGDEEQFPSAKRFDSRQHPEPANRPALTITYVPSPGASLLLLAGAAAATPLRRRRWAAPAV
jgi:hypothetical protein